MLRLALKELKTSLILFLFLTLLTGILYPFLVTGLAQAFFHHEANGSLLMQGNNIVGSRLIGQSFTDPGFFWGRPSATSPFPYNGASSSGSNLGPTNPDFQAVIRERAKTLQAAFPVEKQAVPVELVTASGSGLDPDISPLSAYYQVARIAAARQIDEKNIYELIQQQIIPRTFGILGEPRVNVMQLNLALLNIRK